MRLRRAAATAVLLVHLPLVPALAQPASTQPAPALAAHRALYKLTLDRGHSGDVVGATGTMSYEVQDACDGWAVQQRLDMTITNRDGQDIQMVSDYATWEAKNGSKLRFRMRQTTDTAVTEQTSGEASMGAKGGDIHYVEPADNTIKLEPGTLFPMAHTARLIEGAEEGKKFLTIPLFDGTSTTGGQDTSVIVTDWSGPADFRIADLGKLPSGHVHVAFFDHGSMTPDYEVGMRYWENGVADDLKMNFGDFTMDGTLSKFELPPPHHC